MIILFSSSLPQQGKDTACDYIIKQYGGKRVSFADELKKIATSIGWNGEKDEKGRQLLIDLGMIARKYDSDIWIKLAIEKIRCLIKDGYNVIITDCRFLNEKDKISEFFTRTKIYHIGISSDEIGDVSRINDESQIDFNKMNFDFHIKTTKDKNLLYKNIDNIVSKINEEV